MIRGRTRSRGGSAGGGAAPVTNTIDLNFGTGTYNLNGASAAFADVLTFSRASDGTRFNSSGVLVTETTDAPRFDHDPNTFDPLGLLLEDQRTNLAPYSAELTTGYAGDNGTKTNAFATAPDGTTTATRYTPNGVNGGHSILANGVWASGVEYTFSVYAKSNGYTTVGLGVFAGSDFAAKFLLTGAGSVGAYRNPNITSSGIQQLANSWYRIWITFTTTGANTGLFGIQLHSWPDPASTNWNAMGAGNGTSGALFWGLQAEAGNYPSSYIYTTTGSSVTRSADVCPFTAAGNTALNSASRTVIQTGQAFGMVADRRIFGDAGADADGSIFAETASSIFHDYGAGELNASPATGTMAAYKAGLAFDAGNTALCLNAGTVASTATGQTSSPTSWSLTSGGTGVQMPVQRVSTFDCYNLKMTDGQLQTETT